MKNSGFYENMWDIVFRIGIWFDGYTISNCKQLVINFLAGLIVFMISYIYSIGSRYPIWEYAHAI